MDVCLNGSGVDFSDAEYEANETSSDPSVGLRVRLDTIQSDSPLLCYSRCPVCPNDGIHASRSDP